MFIKRLNAIFVTLAIILGLILIVYAVSQFDIELGKKLAKWESQKAGVVQEMPSVKTSEED